MVQEQHPPRRQHYLPATLIANFSLDETPRRRKRRVAALLRNAQGPRTVSAESIGYINNLYDDPSEPNPHWMELAWQGYEQDLGGVLLRLATGGSLTAKQFVRVLVPFVAGLLVRSVEFIRRFERRPLVSYIRTRTDIGDNNSNRQRIIELQRLLAPILAADWAVIHRTQGPRLISSDLGYALFGRRRAIGYAIPISPDAVLVVVLRQGGEVLFQRNDEWYPVVRHLPMKEKDESAKLNELVATYANYFVFGAEHQDVAPYELPFRGTPPVAPEPGMLGLPDPAVQAAHQYDWHRLASFLEKTGAEQVSAGAFDISWRLLNRGWTPPLLLPLKKRASPSGLLVWNGHLYLHLTGRLPPTTDVVTAYVLVPLDTLIAGRWRGGVP